MDGLNLIVIVSDTFRWDNLAGHFKVREGVFGRTPNLDRLASESIIFNRAYHASFPTVPNRADLLTGRFTFTYYDWSPLSKDEIVLPEVLREAGYTSMMVVDTPHIIKDGYHFDRGFDGWVWIRGQENDRYRTSPQEVELPCRPEKLRSVETTVQHLRNNALRLYEEDWIPAKTAKVAMNWLEENYGQKFLLYVDFFDPHEPWDPPKRYVEMYDQGYKGEEVIYPAYRPRDYLRDEELLHIRAMYAGEVTLVDKWIGALLEKVEELGLCDRTVVLFTSDHGFYLGEHGLVGKSIIMNGQHGLAPLYEEVCHIPLLVRPADRLGWERGKVIEKLVQTPDITATILDLAGVKESPRVQGRTLGPLVSGEANDFRDFAISTPSLIGGVRAGLRSTVTTKDWALILAPKTGPTPEEPKRTMIVDGVSRVLMPFGKVSTELYELRRDPGQQENVLAEHKELAKEMHSEFVRFLRELRTREEVIKPWLKCDALA